MPTKNDLKLHAISLMIADVFNEAYNDQDTEDSSMSEDLLMAFRCVRRHITKGQDGKRYGSSEAFQMMKGE